MDFYPVSEERYYLQRLSRFLNYTLSTSFLYISSFFWSFVFTVAVIASIIFLPLMMYAFIKLRKKAWIISFVLTVIVPSAAFIVLGYILGYLKAFLFIPLAFFYFYCFILKNVINDRLEELLAHERLELEKEEEKKKNELWLSRFDNHDNE